MQLIGGLSCSDLSMMQGTRRPKMLMLCVKFHVGHSAQNKGQDLFPVRFGMPCTEIHVPVYTLKGSILTMTNQSLHEDPCDRPSWQARRSSELQGSELPAQAAFHQLQRHSSVNTSTPVHCSARFRYGDRTLWMSPQAADRKRPQILRPSSQAASPS